jgi:hypothetical protein
MKKGPPRDKGGPEKAQSKPHQKTICAKSSPSASTKITPRRLPPEILSAVARSGRRPITLAGAKAPKAMQPAIPAQSVKPASLADLKAAARKKSAQ